MQRFWIAGVASLIVAAGMVYVAGHHNAAAQSGTRTFGGNSGTSRSVPRRTAAYEEKFWTYLQETKPAYRNWAPYPGTTGDATAGESPHGAFVKLYLNRTAAGNSQDLPYGSILVKEDFSEDRQTLEAVTIMYRVKDFDPAHNDWYYAKYQSNGTIARQGGVKMAGKVQTCINCHARADGKDYAFAND